MNRYGLFSFGQLSYALPLQRMVKIIYQCAGFRLPKLASEIAEVLVDGDVLIPLLSLSRPGVGDLSSARSVEYKVVVESEAGQVAFPADLTYGIVTEQKGRLLPVSEDCPEGSCGLFVYQEIKYMILDVDGLAFETVRQL